VELPAAGDWAASFPGSSVRVETSFLASAEDSAFRRVDNMARLGCLLPAELLEVTS